MSKKKKTSVKDFRKSLKATKIDSIKKAKEEEDADFGGGGGYIDIEDGQNRLRLLPPHPESDLEKPLIMRKVHWVTLENEDDGKEYRTTVRNGARHGNMEQDVIEAYIERAKKFIQGNKKDKNRAEKLAAVAASSYNGGLQGTVTWMAYACKITGKAEERKFEFGLLEMKKSVRDWLYQESIMEGEDDAIEQEIDPFTDPDEGRSFIVTYDKNAKKAADYYKMKTSAAMPLPDEVIEQFMEATPLYEIYANSYTTADFDKAIEALQFFDDKHDIGLFDEEDWLDFVDELREQVDEAPESDEDEEEQPKKSKKDKKKKKKVVVEVEEEDEEEDDLEEDEEEDEEDEDGDEFDEMNRAELKTAMKQHIKNDGDAARKFFKIKKSMSDDDLRNMLRKYDSNLADSDEDEKPEKSKKSGKKLSLKDVQKKLKKGK